MTFQYPDKHSAQKFHDLQAAQFYTNIKIVYHISFTKVKSVSGGTHKEHPHMREEKVPKADTGGRGGGQGKNVNVRSMLRAIG